MLQLLGKAVLLLIGLALISDTGLPIRKETLQVDQHTSSGGARHAAADTSYTIHLVGGQVSSCDVGYSAYTRLQDGDSVVVKSTRLFKSCIQIDKDSEVISNDKYWRIIGFVIGCLLIATAFGWIDYNDDD